MTHPATFAPVPVFPTVDVATPLNEYPSEKLMRQVETTPLPDNVASLLRQARERAPDTPALNMFEDDTVLTYAQLADSVTRLASGLDRIGVRHNSHVGIMVDTNETYPISWLALGTLGAVTVPINSAYTSRELSYMLRDADCSTLIIEEKFLSRLADADCPQLPPDRVIVIGERRGQGYAWHDLLNSGDKDFRPQKEPVLDDVLNIQYTSGTTGLPKGAMLSHRGLMTHGRVGSAQLMDAATNILIAQPFYYITAQWQFLMTLFQAGTAFMPRRQSSSRFMDWVRTYNIHFCNFPEIVSRAPEIASDRENALVVIYCYSHRLENYRKYESRYGCVVRQGFSMTETALVTYVPVEADHMTGTGTSGIAAAYREVRICTPDGTEASDGEIGELCVRGPGILLGYYNKPEATRDAFHPGGWFRTGDVARKDTQGWIWYLGRAKDMVKRSGESISATEVEAVLRSVEGVLEAAILPVPDATRGEEVKAYILLSEGNNPAEISPERIVSQCAQQLARFKIPRYFEYVDEFPRTPGGKIRKAALRNARPDLTSGSYDVDVASWLK